MGEEKEKVRVSVQQQHGIKYRGEASVFNYTQMLEWFQMFKLFPKLFDVKSKIRRAFKTHGVSRGQKCYMAVYMRYVSMRIFTRK